MLASETLSLWLQLVWLPSQLVAQVNMSHFLEEHARIVQQIPCAIWHLANQAPLKILSSVPLALQVWETAVKLQSSFQHQDSAPLAIIVQVTANVQYVLRVPIAPSILSQLVVPHILIQAKEWLPAFNAQLATTVHLRWEALWPSVRLVISVNSVRATAQNALPVSLAPTSMLPLMNVSQELSWPPIAKQLHAQYALRGQPAQRRLSQPVLHAKQQSFLLSGLLLAQHARLKASVWLIEWMLLKIVG